MNQVITGVSVDDNYALRPNSNLYLAHPISANPITGTTEENLDALRGFARQVLSVGHIPLTPYFSALSFLDDKDPGERAAGFYINKRYFDRGFIDALVLCSNFLSAGMWDEVGFAQDNNVPIISIERALRNAD